MTATDQPSRVIIEAIQWKPGPARTYVDPLTLTVRFRVREPIAPAEFDIHVYYIASITEVDDADIELEEAIVENFRVGEPSELTLVINPPRAEDMDPDLIHGMTNIIVTFSFRQQTWMRVAYYLSSMYDDQILDKCPPEPPIVARLMRQIHDGEHRSVSTFPIQWDESPIQQPVSADGAGSSCHVDVDEDGAPMPTALPMSVACSAAPDAFPAASFPAPAPPVAISGHE